MCGFRYWIQIEFLSDGEKWPATHNKKFPQIANIPFLSNLEKLFDEINLPDGIYESNMGYYKYWQYIVVRNNKVCKENIDYKITESLSCEEYEASIDIQNMRHEKNALPTLADLNAKINQEYLDSFNKDVENSFTSIISNKQIN